MAGPGVFSILARGFLAGAISTTTLASLYTYAYKTDIHIDYQEDQFSGKPHLTASASAILKYGAPDRGPNVRIYNNHVLSYDQSKKIPLWVAEYLTKDNLKGEASRRKSRFKSDPDIPRMFSAINADYLGSGWSRGHMAPAGDNKRDQDAMDDTFYLSNILPQNLDNNAGFWNLFEIYCRDLTKKFSDVFVISGPVFLPTEENGKRFMKYELTGEDDVAVPTHLYKVIVAENTNMKTLGVFIIPNEPIKSKQSLKNYQVPLEQLESSTGLHFLEKLDRSSARDLCEVEGCKLSNKKELDLFYIHKRLVEANNLNSLEKAWSELARRNYKPTKKLLDAYNEKVRSFREL